MNNIALEIVIPVFNEGENVLKLMKLFEENIKTNFRVLFCYDLVEEFIDTRMNVILLKNNCY